MMKKLESELKKIRAISMAAANYLETEVIPRYGRKKAEDLVSDGYEVFDLLLWQASPQGWKYWKNLWDEVHNGE